MRAILNWFQGSGGHGVEHQIRWGGRAACLWTACSSEQETTDLAAVVGRLFPERVCDCPAPNARLIHFNNAPETTRDEIDKIMRTYELEYL